jgi:hypothetical protein
MKKQLRQILALILAFTMAVSLCVTSAMAVELDLGETASAAEDSSWELLEEDGEPVLTEEPEDSSAEAVEELETEPETAQSEVTEENTYLPEEAEVHTIVGFAEQEDNRLYYSINNKPSLEELVKEMPSTLTVKLDNGEQTEVAVSWACVGEDYETSEGYYFQFSPVWAEGYELSNSIDLVTEAPYVAVFFTAANDSEISTFSVTSNANEEKIFTFLVNEIGFNTAAACGVLANIYYESAFDPTATGDNGTSYGICQWHNERWDAMKTWCNNNGYNWKNLEGQLNYLKFELSKNDSNYLWNGKTIYNYMIDVENTASGAYDAGYYWCVKYEIPANAETVGKTRGNLAKNSYWAEYGKAVVPATPVLTKVSNVSTGVKVQWEKAANASGYYVFRKEPEGSWKKIKTITSGKTVSYTDTTAKNGVTYVYTVQAYDGFDLTSDYDETGLTITYVAAPTLTGVVNQNAALKVQWEAVEGVDGYRVYRKAGSETSWTTVASKLEGGDLTSWKDTDIKNGTQYTYTVKAYKVVEGTTVWSGYVSAGVSAKRLSTPTLTKVSNSSSGVTFTWGKVSGASGYRVYRKASSETKWTKVATVKSGSTVSWTDTSAKNGTKYTYTVRAYTTVNGEQVLSSYDSTGKTILRLSTPSISKLTAGSKKITVKWGTNSKATGYQIEYSTSSNFSNSTRIKVEDKSTASKVISNLTKGKKYYVRIRSYKVSGSTTYYSGWSGKKNTTVK